MKIFLLCTDYGDVIDVITGNSFEEVYSNTIAKNNGDILVELTKEVIEKINEILKNMS